MDTLDNNRESFDMDNVLRAKVFDDSDDDEDPEA